MQLWQCLRRDIRQVYLKGLVGEDSEVVEVVFIYANIDGSTVLGAKVHIQYMKRLSIFKDHQFSYMQMNFLFLNG